MRVTRACCAQGPDPLAAGPNRSSKRPRWFGCVLLAGWAIGCQGPLGAGRLAFEESRYPDAVAQLRRLDPSELAADERARWALYLGLSELSLGNLQRAIPRLSDAQCRLQADPSSLTPAERGQLSSAWLSLGKMPGEPLSAPCPP
jgi:hypothetical protein